MSLSALKGADVTAIESAVATVCETLAIADKLNRNTDQLSGGEWQRVRLAGVCLQIWPDINPDGRLLILDEPATALDIAQQSAMYKMVRMLADRGIAVVMSNHDLNRSLSEADRVVMLKLGTLIANGKPADTMNLGILETVYGAKLRIVELEGERVILS